MKNFIKIIDNVGDSYYINPNEIAYLKSALMGHSMQQGYSSSKVHKIVLKNEKQILISSEADFNRVKGIVYGK